MHTEISEDEVDRFCLLARAVEEWQAARKDIFAYPMKTPATEEQLALWQRLSEAESNLMEI